MRHRRRVIMLCLLSAVLSLPVRACELTSVDLQTRVLRLLRSEYPAKAFAPGKSLDVVTMGEIEFGLVNLRSKLCGAPLSLAEQDEEIKAHFAALMVMVDDRGQLMPKTWEAVRNLVSLQLVSTDYLRLSGAEGVPITRSFIPGVIVGMVVDIENGYSYVREEDRAAWGISAEGLYQQALANLEKSTEKIALRGANGEDKFLAIEEKDGYDAVRILVPWVREEAAKFLGNPFVAAVSNRDFLIMWSASNSSDFYDHALKNVAEDFEAQPYSLSPQPFKIWSDGRIEPFDR